MIFPLIILYDDDNNMTNSDNNNNRNRIFLPEASRNGINKWVEVGLLTDSLVTKHFWRHLCLHNINEIKPHWTVHIHGAAELTEKR